MGELQSGDSARRAQVVDTTYNGSLLTWAIGGQGALSDWLRGDVAAVLTPYRREAPTDRASSRSALA